MKEVKLSLGKIVVMVAGQEKGETGGEGLGMAKGLG